MNWIDVLGKIFELCIFPLLEILTCYLIYFIRKKASELQEKTNNELRKKYINLLQATISNCVIATKQTYVESLKAQGAFGMEEQKAAFKKTYSAVMSILTDEAKAYLKEALNDFEGYVTAQIEAQVNINK